MKVTALSGGVGGARLLRGFDAVDEVELTAIVNIGDDDVIYGLHVSPDIDTVIYSLAGVQGSQGWGIADDTNAVLTSLEKFPIDTWFRMGDSDIATNLFRTTRLGHGWTLSQVTTAQAAVFGLKATIIPASDDPLRTEISVKDEGWIPFQSYFVDRQHQAELDDIRFSGAWAATPSPGVLEAIETADVVVIGPSNPPLSIWPILSVAGVADAVAAAGRVIAVSPLFGGLPLKGPADRVMDGVGLPAGTEGILAAYEGLIDELVIDVGDEGDLALIDTDVVLRATDTRIAEIDAARALAEFMVES